MKAGFAKIIITPSESLDLWGFVGREGKSNGVLDDIYVKSLVIQYSNQYYTLLSFDLGGIDEEFSDSLKKMIQDRIGIKIENICTTVTHTHSAPSIFKLRNAGSPKKSFVEQVKLSAVESINSAINDLEEVKVGYGVGKLVLGVNRRERGFRSDINQPSGTIDPNLSIVRIDRKDNNPKVILVNYAMHPVTLYRSNLSLSADYPGYISKYIEDNLSSEMIFLQGTCANINPKIYGGIKEREKIGNIIGSIATKIARKISTVRVEKLLFSTKSINLPIEKNPSEGQLVSIIEKYMANHAKLTIYEKAEYQWAKDYLKVIKNQRNKGIDNKVPVLIQCCIINNILFLFLPGEIFVETGLRLKQTIHNAKIIIVAYSNNSKIGYLPTKQAFLEGKYEVNEAYKYYGLYQFTEFTEDRLFREVINFINLNS